MVDASQTSVTLLGRLRQFPQDQYAWRDFVNLYGRRIFSWCRRWGLQEADSADVTQTVLLKLAKELPRFEYNPLRSFRGWLKTLAHHAWQDLVNNRQRLILRTAEGEETLTEVSAPEDLATRLEEAFDQELLAMAEIRVRLRVEPITWEAYRLTAQEEMPPEDVALRLGTKLTNVYKARSNILKKLQEEVRRLEEERL